MLTSICMYVQMLAVKCQRVENHDMKAAEKAIQNNQNSFLELLGKIR